MAAPLRLAVLLCTHNGEAFLAAQIQSLLRQTYPPAGVFVHDWGSHDGTLKIIHQACQTAPPGMTWDVVVHPDAPGPGPSFLRSLAACMNAGPSFDYLFFCDQDDLWHADKLKCFVETIHHHPLAELLYSDVSLIDARGAQLAPTYLGKGGAFGRPMDVAHGSSLFVSTVCGMSMAVSRQFLARSRPLWAAAEWATHDWTFIIAAYLCKAQVVFIAKPLVAYRQHDGNLVGGQTPSSTNRGALGAIASLRETYRLARCHVKAVQEQYSRIAALPQLPGWRRLSPSPTRWAVAASVLMGGSLPPLKRLKVAFGYACFWPRR